MDKKKMGMAAVVAMGVVAFAVARSRTTVAQSEPGRKQPVKATAAPAMPAAPGAGMTVPHPAAPVAVTPPMPAGPAGKAEIKETVFDAGTVERGAELSHAFSIKNVGEHDLTVDAKPG